MEATEFVCPTAARLITSALGFGGAPLGNLFEDIPEARADATLEAAWAAGMRLFDVAPLYGLGLAEERVGRFLRDKPRAGFTISTKVGRVLEDCPPEEATPDKFLGAPSRKFAFDYSYDGVMRSFEQSLERLGLDRVNVLLCHDLDRSNHGAGAALEARYRTFMDGGYRALFELRAEGVIDAIGAGLNEWEIAERMAREAEFDLFLLAGRYTLLEQAALESFLPFCEERGIGVLIGGAFNSGILATGARPGARFDYAPAPPEILDRVARIEAVCARHGVALAAAALAFPAAHPAVFSIIPGLRAPEEVATAMALRAAAIPNALWSDLKNDGLLRADAPTPKQGDAA